MENLDQSLATIVDKLQILGFAQAPEVIDGAIRAIYYDGMLQIVLGTILGILCIGFGVLARWGIINDTRESSEVCGVVGLTGGILAGFGTLILLTASNPWLKVFDPQAYFYQSIMQSILGLVG